MKRRDLVFVQSPEWLPKQLSKEAGQKCEKTDVIPSEGCFALSPASAGSPPAPAAPRLA